MLGTPFFFNVTRSIVALRVIVMNVILLIVVAPFWETQIICLD